METYAVVGLGYVGLGLAIAFSQHHQVYGYDISRDRIQQLLQHIDKNHDISSDALRHSKITFTHQLTDISRANFFIITVSTPAWYYTEPDLSPLISAVENIATVLKQGDTIVFESTVYPGTTEEICIPILEKISQLKSGQDFFVGYSPERINPGDRVHTLKNVPKIISGQTASALARVQKAYQSICEQVYPVSSIQTAEAIKILENTQRDINIAFMNEFTKIMHALSLNTHEIIEAAKTKWSFVPFKPGFVGGHCISIDPHYLAFKAKRMGVYPELVLTARHINDDITQFVIQSMLKLMVQNKIALQSITVGVLGISYKENVNDIRNSLALKLIKELRTYQQIKYVVHDPMNNDMTHLPMNIQLVSSLEEMQSVDIVLLLVGHDEYKKLGLIQILNICKKAVIFMDIPNLFVETVQDVNTKLLYWCL